jgi:hypothetical protein
MKRATVKLKRYKALYLIMNILLFPFRFPIFLLYILGSACEFLLNIFDGFFNKSMMLLVKIFKLEK